MVLEGEATPSRVELPLLKAVARARRWALELISEQVNSVDEIARREHLDKRSVRRLLRLGFLSPRIIEAIAEGYQPRKRSGRPARQQNRLGRALHASTLRHRSDLPERAIAA